MHLVAAFTMFHYRDEYFFVQKFKVIQFMFIWCTAETAGVVGIINRHNISNLNVISLFILKEEEKDGMTHS